MRNKGKVRAFAIQEMMVVLAITAIVVGMAFSVLRLVQNQMGNIGDIYEVKLEANKLRQSLWIDFNRYSYAFYDQKKAQLYFSNEIEEKVYTLTENRFATERDTILLWKQSSFILIINPNNREKSMQSN